MNNIFIITTLLLLITSCGTCDYSWQDQFINFHIAVNKENREICYELRDSGDKDKEPPPKELLGFFCVRRDNNGVNDEPYPGSNKE